MDFDFELTETEVKALKALNNEISEDVTKKVIVNAVKQLLVKGPGEIFNQFNYFSKIYSSTLQLFQ